VLSAFLSAFKTPDLRKKLLFTLAIIGIYRLGASLPSPGVSYGNVQACIAAINDPKNTGDQAGVFTLLNLFSGGALLQLSVFALGIMPYITASIILQLLTVVIPRFEQLKKEGQAGQAKITQYTRYLTLGLAVLQASAFVALARSGQLFGNTAECVNNPIIPDAAHGQKLPIGLVLAILVITMTAGTGMIMWLGELVTDRGVGNGMSVLIFTSIAARLPTEGYSIWQKSPTTFFLVLGIGLSVIAFVIFLEQAQRRVPVQYAKRMVGRRMYGGTSTYIPLKVNQAGVIPVIFASSLLYLPQLAVSLGGQNSTSKWVVWINRNLVNQGSPVYISAYFLMILFFTYFYVSITFNPTEVADNMKKYGGFVPGIRPGKPTAEYLDYILSRITLPGAIYLGIIAVLPNLFITLVGGNKQNFPFGGTAVLIIVGVGLETVKQIESQLMQRNYEGFLR